MEATGALFMLPRRFASSTHATQPLLCALQSVGRAAFRTF